MRRPGESNHKREQAKHFDCHCDFGVRIGAAQAHLC
jgi:hypothetical protein